MRSSSSQLAAVAPADPDYRAADAERERADLDLLVAFDPDGSLARLADTLAGQRAPADHPSLKSIVNMARLADGKAALPVSGDPGARLAGGVRSQRALRAGQRPLRHRNVALGVVDADFRQMTHTNNTAVVAHGTQKPTSVYSSVRKEAGRRHHRPPV